MIDNSDGIERAGPSGVHIVTEGTGTLAVTKAPSMNEFEDLKGIQRDMADAIGMQRADFRNLEDRFVVMEMQVKVLRKESLDNRLSIGVLKRHVQHLQYVVVGLAAITLITLIHSMGLI